MKLIQFFDSLAISHIWVAAEKETKVKYPDLKGDAFYEKVALRTEEIIYRTQPNYTPMQRSEFGRSQSLALRTMLLFSTQTNKNYNLVYKAMKTSKKNPKKASQMIGAVMAGNMIVAMISAGRSRYRGYEDSVWKQFFSAMLGMGYFIREIANTFLFKWETENLVESTINDLVNSTNELLDFGSNKTLAGKMVDVGFAISSATGYGTKNVEREISTAMKHLNPELYYEYQKLLKEPTRTDMYDLLWTTKDTRLKKQVISDLKKDGATQENVSSSAKGRGVSTSKANSVKFLFPKGGK